MTPDIEYRQVDRRAGLSVREFVREYRARCRPVVLAGALEDWPARSRWTFEYFRSRCGRSPVEVHRYDSAYGYRVDSFETMPFAHYIDRVLQNDWDSYPCYLRDNWRLLLLHPELLADYRMPPYFFDWFRLLPPFMRLVYPRVFIGPRGAITPLHHDIWESHFWMAQLVGRKRWILVLPDQRRYLHDYRVRLAQPDLERFPLFRLATPYECTVGPGDLIFVPGGWAHEVISLDPTISLTYNYMGPGCFRTCLTNSVREQLLPRLTPAYVAGFLRRRIPGVIPLWK